MKQYQKIKTIFRREEKSGRLIEGEYSKPEFDLLKDINWTFTEKIDGTNIRIIWDGSNVYFRGRSDKSEIPKHLSEKLNQLFTDYKMQRVFGNTPVCLYGEGYGHKIQKYGDYYLDGDTSFIMFDCKINNWWIQRGDMENIAHALGIKTVPVITNGSLLEAVQLVKIGFESRIAQHPLTAEGLVIKPPYELFDRKGNRIITKIKYKDFNYG
jgi:ATP-dependent RNA circularization protein (DNA/RNA ligase family)